VERLEDRACPAVTLNVGPNVNVSPNTPGDQAEETVAILPSSGGTTAFVAAVDMARLQSGTFNYGLFTARYAGGSWAKSAKDLGTGFTTKDGGDDLPAATSDPSAAYDAFGNLFVSYNASDISFFGWSAAAPQGGQTLTDSNAQWATNEWAGLQVYIVATKELETIASNDSTTLRITAQNGWQNAIANNSQYRIVLPGAIQHPGDTRGIAVVLSTDQGRTFRWLAWLDTIYGDRPTVATGPGTLLDHGTASGGTLESLFDNTKHWTPNTYVNCLVQITDGTDKGQTGIITDNSSTQLDISGFFSAPPDASSKYQILTGLGSVWVTWASKDDGKWRATANGAPVNGLGQVGAFIGNAQPRNSENTWLTSIAVGPAGQVAMAYDAIGKPAAIYVARDADGLFGGKSLKDQGAWVKAATTQLGSNQYTIPAQHAASPPPPPGIRGYPVLAWDRSGKFNAGTNGVLYLVFTQLGTDNNHETYIVAKESKDGGASWVNRQRISDPTTRSQFLPAAAVDQSTGYIAVSWYDTRADATAILAVIWATISSDGGTTWMNKGANTKIASAPSNANKTPSKFGYGDYSGLDFAGGVFIPAWADNSNSTQNNIDGPMNATDIYVASVSVIPGQAGGGPAGPQVEFVRTAGAGATRVPSERSLPEDQGLFHEGPRPAIGEDGTGAGLAARVGTANPGVSSSALRLETALQGLAAVTHGNTPVVFGEMDQGLECFWLLATGIESSTAFRDGSFALDPAWLNSSLSAIEDEDAFLTNVGCT
jgi:hypothetical protein